MIEADGLDQNRGRVSAESHFKLTGLKPGVRLHGLDDERVIVGAPWTAGGLVTSDLLDGCARRLAVKRCNVDVVVGGRDVMRLAIAVPRDTPCPTQTRGLDAFEGG